MKLYLVQHGESTAKEIDPDRPLTRQGVADVTRIASALARVGTRVGRVIHSGKLRARQTAEILAAEIAPNSEPAVSDGIDPLDDPAGFDWQAASGGDDAMLVGHLPFMAKLVTLLVTGNPEAELVDYRPGSVVCLDCESPGDWRIAWMLRPDMLA